MHLAAVFASVVLLLLLIAIGVTGASRVPALLCVIRAILTIIAASHLWYSIYVPGLFPHFLRVVGGG